MKTLTQLYNENPSTYLGTDKEMNCHHYLSRLYDNVFPKYQDKNINMLEIGLALGGSILLWRDYFPNAQIYGVSLDSDTGFNQCIENLKNVPNFTLKGCDAYTKEAADLLPNFDIIIDDGPHTFDSHIALLDLYMPKLNPGGVLIIEDIDDINWCNQYISKLNQEYNNQAYYTIVDTARILEYNSLVFMVNKLC